MALLYCASPIFGQHNHSSHVQCGTDVVDQEAIMDRLMENRRNKAALLAEFEAFKASRTSFDSVIYIPILFHVISQSDGTGGASWQQVFNNVCAINDFYADQNVQFYIHGINRFNSDQVYVNGTSADYVRSIHKENGVMNVYIGGPYVQGTGYGAYYAPNFDWIFAWNNQISGGGTMAHEIGHYFTLPHTFNGWEGTDYVTASSGIGHAPEMGTNGRPVETVNRGDSLENCQWAADGFCDTPPDYSSGGGACSGAISWKDPNNTTFSLDPSIRQNHMSYFFCNPKLFTGDQKEAMKLDIIQRGYHLFDVPTPLAVDGTANPTTPADGSLAPYTTTAVEFKWDAPAAANRYLVTIERTIPGNCTGVGVRQEYFTSNTSVWANLEPNTSYRWRVESMTAYDPCNRTASDWNCFNTADWVVSTENVQLAIESSRVFPNPSAGSNEVILEVNVPVNTDAQISIFNSLGQNVLPSQNLMLQSGKNLEQINIEALAAGMYIINIETANERISHKLMIQK